MIKHGLFVLATLVLTSTGVAQFIPDTTAYRNIWKFDLLGAFDSDQYLVSYERVVSENVSLLISAGYLGGYHRENEDRGDGIFLRKESVRTGYTIRPEFRYYLSEFTGSRRPIAAFMSLYPFYQRSVRTVIGDDSFVTGSVTDDPFPGVGWPMFGVEWYDLIETQQQYGVGAALGGQFFVKGGIGLEFELNANVFYYDFLREGAEYRNGERFDAMRRQVERQVGLSARLFITYGH